MIQNMAFDIFAGVSGKTFNKIQVISHTTKNENLKMPCTQLGNHSIFLSQYIQNLIYQMKES